VITGLALHSVVLELLTSFNTYMFSDYDICHCWDLIEATSNFDLFSKHPAFVRLSSVTSKHNKIPQKSSQSLSSLSGSQEKFLILLHQDAKLSHFVWSLLLTNMRLGGSTDL
jgi:hypothetical protein